MSARRPTPEQATGPDYLMIGVCAVLLAIGLVMVASASVTYADRQYGNPFYFLERQVLAATMGLAIAFVVAKVPTSLWQVVGPWLPVVAILMLVIVLVPGLGHTVNGSTRWLSIAGINIIQVSEPVRLLLLVYVADYAVRRHAELRSSFMGFLKPMLVIGFASLLLLRQPDFGSAVLLVSIAGAILFVAGARIRDLLVTLAPAVALFAALAYFSPYRLQRLTGFMDPWADPFGTGFQLIQSLIAIGTGEWTGLGLGGSVQKLLYLPEAHTDFIFAVIAEEFGLVGSIVMILLYGILIWRALAIARAAAAREQAFQTNLAFGISVWLALQACINLGVDMGILPTKGLTLPLVSYGRSSLLVILAALGLLLRIDLENRGLASAGRRRANARAATP